MDADPAVGSVRVIHRIRDRLHRRWRRLLVGGLGLALLGWLAAGLYVVSNDESAAVLRFGRLRPGIVDPGLRFRFPGVHRVVKARTGDVFRLAVEGDQMPELELVTGDENVIEATLVVQYRISSDLGAYCFATEDPEALVEQAVRTALVESFAVTHVDDVLTVAKAQIQNAVRRHAQERLDQVYGAGVTLVTVNLQAVNPPPEADGAFRAVSDARAEAAQAVNQAHGEKDRGLRLARGEAGQIVAAAEADADQRRHQARGAADRFASLLARQRLAPRQVRTELYTATVQKVLPRARLIFLAPGERPEVEIHLLERPDLPAGPPPVASGGD